MPPRSAVASESEVPPTTWVPHFRNETHFRPMPEKNWAPNTVVHARGGHADTAHGAARLEAGVWRITYEIFQTSSTRALGLLIGVSDCEVWAPPENKASKEIAAIFSKEKKIEPGPRIVAWGLCPSTGKLVTTHDVRAGHLQGALVAKQLVPRASLCHAAKGLTIVIELRMLPLDDDTSAIARREYATPLHPLCFSSNKTKRSKQQVPPPRYNTMRISINGGDFVPADVRLPAAVWPWVLMNWEGDAVTLKSVEKTVEADDM